MPFIFGATFFLLNLMDALFTLWLVQQFGSYEIEANPIMRWLMYSIGDWFLFPKMLIGFLLTYSIIKYWHRFSWWRVASVSIVFIYGCVVSLHIVGLIG